MTTLSVNLNKIALLRNSREGDYPSVIEFAKLAIAHGADGLTVHPRPDQRHIRVDDVYRLSEYTGTLANTEFNIEGNPFASNQGTYPGLMKLVEETRPQQATLVPDSDDQLTSDHGFDLKKDGERLKPIIAQLKQWNVRCSLFMAPDIEQIDLAKSVGADRIELYTGPYALAHKQGEKEKIGAILANYKNASDHANAIGLGVNAGHDLNLDNLKEFLSIDDIAEVSIGHALTVDALILGYKSAIVDYSSICHSK